MNFAQRDQCRLCVVERTLSERLNTSEFEPGTDIGRQRFGKCSNSDADVLASARRQRVPCRKRVHGASPVQRFSDFQTL
jgi:hypothetical protein